MIIFHRKIQSVQQRNLVAAFRHCVSSLNNNRDTGCAVEPLEKRKKNHKKQF